MKLGSKWTCPASDMQPMEFFDWFEPTRLKVLVLDCSLDHRLIPGFRLKNSVLAIHIDLEDAYSGQLASTGRFTVHVIGTGICVRSGLERKVAIEVAVRVNQEVGDQLGRLGWKSNYMDGVLVRSGMEKWSPSRSSPEEQKLRDKLYEERKRIVAKAHEARDKVLRKYRLPEGSNKRK